MKLSRLLIENFRGIRSLELDLDDTTVLIGENNSGKTAILDAIRLCLRGLGPRRPLFEPYDFHLATTASDPSSAEPIQITLTFAEGRTQEWPEPLVGRLNRLQIVQIGPEDRNQVSLRVRRAYDSANQEPEWEFLTAEGQPLKNLRISALTGFQDEISYFYLAALRDAARHFDPKGQFWRPFLRDSRLTPAQKAEIEESLKAVNDRVVSSHTSFEQARIQLGKLQEIVPLSAGNAVSIEAIPARMFDLLSKAQVHLGTATGAKVPVDRHGEGTQSLAVLMLFSAFLKAWPTGTQLVALEEPEAHLHPAAIRALWSVFDDLPGQKLISTHSGDLLSEVPVTKLRRLVKTPEGTKAFRLENGTLDEEQTRKFDFHIRQSRGELLFARCWLLVEGETEMVLLPELARLLRINLERAGVRCVPHRHASIELFLKVARDFGIGCCVLADNDSQGQADQKHARNYAGSTSLAQLLHVMPENDIETHLCASGFLAVYESLLSDQTRNNFTTSPSDPNYNSDLVAALKKSISKPAAAAEVLKQIHNGSPVPELLKKVIENAVLLARCS